MSRFKKTWLNPTHTLFVNMVYVSSGWTSKIIVIKERHRAKFLYFHVSSWKWGGFFPKLCVQRDVHWTFESFGVKVNGVKSRWVLNSKSKENVAWPSIPLQIVPISISQRKLTTDYALRNYRLLRATGNPHSVFFLDWQKLELLILTLTLIKC